MPLYLFVCNQCGKHMELLLKSTEIHEARCIECKSDNLFRALTTHGSYTINGNNSASVTPKRFRKH